MTETRHDPPSVEDPITLTDPTFQSNAWIPVL